MISKLSLRCNDVVLDRPQNSPVSMPGKTLDKPSHFPLIRLTQVVVLSQKTLTIPLKESVTPFILVWPQISLKREINTKPYSPLDSIINPRASLFLLLSLELNFVKSWQAIPPLLALLVKRERMLQNYDKITF